MHLSIRVAKKGEYEKVKDFYYTLIDEMQGCTYHPKWQKGVYPEDSYLKESTENGLMYLCEKDGEIVGAMVISHLSNDGYKKVAWQINPPQNEVSIIHTLGVMPSSMRCGVGSFMVTKAFEIAKAKGQKALRLDVLKGNLPAQKLYTKLGFKLIDTVALFYEDTGWCDFLMYEYIL